MNAIKIAAILQLLLISTIGMTQKKSQLFTFEGTVYSSSGTILPNATIMVPDLKKGTVSDTLGHFKINEIPKGSFIVEVDYSGFKPVIETIDFNKNIQRDFHLQVSVTEEKEIIVTGVSRATSMKRNPVPMVSVSRKALEQSLSTNAIDALKILPGISAVSTGPNVSKPFIRGLGYNRVLTLFDGNRQEGQQWGDEHGIEIDENAVDRVEIIKGPASLMYGSDAIAGVINFLPATALPQGEMRGRVSLNYQTNNNLLEGSADWQQHVKNTSFSLVASHKIAADYQNSVDGRVYNTGYRQTSLFGSLTLHGSHGYSKFGASVFNDAQEIPDGKRDSATRKFEKEVAPDVFEIVPSSELRSYAISGDYQRVAHYRIYNNSSFSLGEGRAFTQLGFQKSVRKEFESGEDDPALFLDLNSLTYNAKYLFPDFSNINITAGVNGMYQQNKSDRGHEFLIPSYKQFDAGPFVFARYGKNKFEWAGGLRYDFRNVNTSAIYVVERGGEMIPVYGSDTVGATNVFRSAHHSFSGLSGSLGFSYEFNRQWSLKVNVARGFRAPNISEISANGIHSGSQFYQLGNDNFKPEFSFQQDIGVSLTTDHVTMNASIFNNRIQNYIYNHKLISSTGSDSTIVEGYPTFQYAASRADLWGAELLIDVHPHPLDWLHFENALSFVNAKNLGSKGGGKVPDDEKYLPFIPPLHWRSELKATIQHSGRFENIFFKISSEVFAAQKRVFRMNNTETPTPAYQLINGGLGADWINGKGHTICTITLLAQNIFDVAYQSNLSRLKYFEDYPDDPRGHHGLYNMGRNVSIKLTLPLGGKRG